MGGQPLEIAYQNLLYVLGYIKGKNDCEFTPFEGNEEESIRIALGLVKDKIEERTFQG